jgi:hypothetical protein
MLELNADIRYRDESTPRYARWPVLDKQRQVDAPWCWLDRRTGRLVYQPDQVDPNASQVFLVSTDMTR